MAARSSTLTMRMAPRTRALLEHRAELEGRSVSRIAEMAMERGLLAMAQQDQLIDQIMAGCAPTRTAQAVDAAPGMNHFKDLAAPSVSAKLTDQPEGSRA